VIDNQQLRYIIALIGKPVLTGLFVATVLLGLFPEFRSGANDSSRTRSMDLRDSNVTSGWSGPASYASAVSRAAPSVVNIYTLTVTKTPQYPPARNPNFGRPYNGEKLRSESSLGSGVIMQADGFILTNHHVINGADRILVMLYDGRQASATVVGSDPDTDLAVLKINADQLQPISVGEPSQARIGDVVLAIGNPLGVGQTVTQGIVSATHRNGLGLNVFENFIQTDADINPGNSGGALIDTYGNLLGINTATLNQSGTSGIGFAIPADAAEKVLKDIIQYGRVIRGWLGLSATYLSSRQTKQLNLPFSRGFLITAVAANGPAQLAGIELDDIVIGFDGSAITDPQSNMSQIADMKPGETIKLGVFRQGKNFEIDAVAGTRPTD
jgi:serine protease DegS